MANVESFRSSKNGINIHFPGIMLNVAASTPAVIGGIGMDSLQLISFDRGHSILTKDVVYVIIGLPLVNSCGIKDLLS